MADIPLKTIHLSATGTTATVTGPIPVAPVVPAISSTPTGKVPPLSANPTGRVPPLSTIAAPANAPTITTATQAFKVKTIGMRPVVNGAAPAAAPSAAPTIKLGGAAPASPAAATTATQAIKVRTIGMRPSLNPNGAASPTPTIKLGKTGAAPASPTPTIKLGGAAAPASASAPTIKLGGSAAPSSASAPTIKLGDSSAPSGSAPSIKLGGSGSPTIKLTKPGESAAPGGIKLNIPAPGQVNEEEDVEGENGEVAVKENDDATTGADVAFLIVRIVAFLVIGWMIFVMSAQFANMYNGKDIKIPGLVRVSAGEK